MLFQRFPWKAQSLSELAEKVASYPVKFKDKLSPDMKTVLKQLLSIEEHERPLAKDVLKEDCYLRMIEKYGIS